MSILKKLKIILPVLVILTNIFFVTKNFAANGDRHYFDGPVDADAVCLERGDSSKGGWYIEVWKDDPVLVKILEKYGGGYNTFANQVILEFRTSYPLLVGSWHPHHSLSRYRSFLVW